MNDRFFLAPLKIFNSPKFYMGQSVIVKTNNIEFMGVIWGVLFKDGGFYYFIKKSPSCLGLYCLSELVISLKEQTNE